MKKKLALLLACIMLVAVATPLNVFAGSTNSLKKSFTAMAEGTVFIDERVSGVTKGAWEGTVDGEDVVAIQDSMLTVKPDKFFGAGSFTIKLENADWFFRDGVTLNGAAGKSTYSKAHLEEIDDDQFYDSGLKDITVAYDNVNNKHERLPYTITVDPGNSSIAIIEYEDSEQDVDMKTAFADGAEMFYIPIVAITTADADVKVKVAPDNSSVVSESNLTLSRWSSGATVTSVESVVEGNLAEWTNLKRIAITESRVGVMREGWFKLTLADDYEFNVPASAKVYSFGQGGSTPIAISKGSGIEFISAKDEDNEDSVLYFYLDGYAKSVSRANVIYIEGLQVRIKDEDSELLGNVSMTIENVTRINNMQNKDGYAYSNGTTGSKSYTVDEAKIDKQTITIAKRTEEAMKFTATTSKDVWSGKLEEETAEVTLAETIINSWDIPKRDAKFTLVDEDGVELDTVKITKVEFTDFTNFKYSLKEEDYIYADEDTGYGSAGTGSAAIKMKDNNFTISSFERTADKATSLSFKVYISAQAGFEGPVYLVASSKGFEGETLNPVHIADVHNQYKINTKQTQVQIGYQIYPVADITITEAEAGLWEKGQFLRLEIQDYVGKESSDIIFNEVIKKNNIEVDEASGISVDVGNGKAKSYVSFEIKTASKSAPASVRFHGLALYINRVVPFGEYRLLLGGDAIADNTYIEDKLAADAGDYDSWDETQAYFDGYVKVATEGVNNVASKNVKITEDSKVVLIDGKEWEMEVAPQLVGGSFLVPIRFVSMALGIAETNVHWDPVNATCTIITDKFVVVFKENSEIMTINGAPITMVDDAGELVKALIPNDRMMVPFRKLGEAFGIKVDWNPETKTAEYNPK